MTPGLAARQGRPEGDPQAAAGTEGPAGPAKPRRQAVNTHTTQSQQKQTQTRPAQTRPAQTRPLHSLHAGNWRSLPSGWASPVSRLCRSGARPTARTRGGLSPLRRVRAQAPQTETLLSGNSTANSFLKRRATSLLGLQTAAPGHWPRQDRTTPATSTQRTALSRRPSSQPLPHNSDTLLEGRPEKTGLQHLFTDLEKKV